MGLSLFLSLLGCSLFGESIPIAAEVPRRVRMVKPSDELDLKPKSVRSTAKEEPKTKADAPATAVSKTQKTSEKKAAAGRPTARLPRFYSQLELQEDQREKLLELQQQFAQQIAALREQITKLLKERDAQLVSVLKPGQKRRLKELQAESGTAKQESRRD